MKRIIDRLKVLHDSGWDTSDGISAKKLDKSYDLNMIMGLTRGDLVRLLETNCIYMILESDNKEEYKMIFNTPGLPQPSPENVQMHTSDVYTHVDNVARFMNTLSSAMNKRAVEHDASKFSEEEMSYYATYTPNLKGLTYGSEEYKENLRKLGPALDHHYAKNPHHPEHYANGINDMDLVDIVEMLCDWKAATMRHNDGNLLKSLETNQKRFNMDTQLYNILLNTVERYFKD
jgi:hypothetical protein